MLSRNFDRFIEAIPGTFDEERPKKYSGINRYVLSPRVAVYALADWEQRRISCPALGSDILNSMLG